MAAPRNNRKPRIQLAARPTAPPPSAVPKNNKIKNLDEVLRQAKEMTDKYANVYTCITDPYDLSEIIKRANNETGRLSIDTETTGLDVFTDQVVGFSVHTPSVKAAYIPLRHLSRFTGKIDTNQMAVEKAAELMNSIDPKVMLDYANAQFDLLDMKYSMGVDLRKNPKNDVLLAARLLNTERKDNNLKALHAEYCGGSRGPRFNELFPAGSFNLCPYSLGYTYAARDAEMTTELSDVVIDLLKQEPGLWNVYSNIEIPLINVLMRMRERGVLIDEAKRAELTTKYRAKMKEAEKKFESLYAPYIPRIRQYQCSPAYAKQGGKISIPVAIGSDAELKVLFFSIMGYKPLDEKHSVDKNFLKSVGDDLCKAILEFRECRKLLSTYLEGLDKFIRPDGCVRATIRQIGADTGRTSCQNPNLQNIPSKNREIRQMYCARPGRVLISCDYSGQEPRLAACVAGDEKMIQTYKDGLDLYSAIASAAFGVPYEECVEHKPDGELYLEGKERRSVAKVIVLALLYGMQDSSLAESLKKPIEEAVKIRERVLDAYPGLKKAQTESIQMAHEKGYVEDLWGRRRHLTAMMHDDYEFEYAPGANPDFDPFNPTPESMSTVVPKQLAKQHENKLKSIKWWKDKAAYIQNLRDEYGIITKDYTKVKTELSRKCLNARVQGGSASLSKLAMITVDADERLKALDCHLELMIHDEVICECPEENAKLCAKYISEDMASCAKTLPVPFKSDAEVSPRWYGKEIIFEEEED